ncbi:MAG: hypothetical protein FWE48_00275 [Coriobacteriia bacterium]|nr:hypothetical protein [Coriobacteriia bacterium]MCL2870852.1 hypothetical protein [Coriobacteriia bacterium]
MSDEQAKSRIGVYLDCDTSHPKEHQHNLNMMEALRLCTDADGQSYEIYVYSAKKVWKNYCKEHSLTYRPFPTSGASNHIGKMLFGKYIDSPKPPEWVGEMLNRKAHDFKVETMIFSAPTTLVQQMQLPTVVVMLDLAANGVGDYDAQWYKDLYQSILKNATAVIVDPTEGTDYLNEALAENPADVKMLSLDASSNVLAFSLATVLRSVAVSSPAEESNPVSEPEFTTESKVGGE